MRVFLSNPDVPIDTNHLERALRIIPMGRIQGINPYTYLVDVLQRVGIHPAKDVLDLVPRVWKTKFADNPLQSDLSIPTSR
jgi:transposase